MDRTSARGRRPRTPIWPFSGAELRVGALALMMAGALAVTAAPAEAQIKDFFKGLFGGEEETAAEVPESAQSTDCLDGTAADQATACGPERPPAPSAEARRFDGVWEVEMPGNPFIAHAVVAVDIDGGHLALRDPNTGSPATGLVRYKDKQGYRQFGPNAKVTESGAFQAKLGAFGFCGCVPLLSEVKPTSQPDLMVGEWTYKEERGLAIWRRRPGIEIRKVTLSRALYDEAGGQVPDRYAYGARPGLVERRHKVTCGAGQARANCDRFWVTVTGENFAGSPSVWIDPAGKMEIREADWICRDGLKKANAWYKCGNARRPGGDVVGVQVKLLLRDGITPGPRTLWIGGQPVPFRFVIHGYPEADRPALPKLVSLQALDDDGAVLEELAESRPFVLEAVYDSAHPDAWVTVKLPGHRPIRTLDTPLGEERGEDEILETRSGAEEILLRRTEDAGVFRSDRYAVAAGPETAGAAP